MMERLEQEDPEAEVMISFPAGDYWRSEVACEPRIAESMVAWSAYHEMWKTYSEEELDDKERPPGDLKSVVLMRGRRR